MTDWIEHTGDTCPVDPETVVEVRYKGHPTNGLGEARVFLWRGPESQWNVTHYRIIAPAKPPEPEMTHSYPDDAELYAESRVRPEMNADAAAALKRQMADAYRAGEAAQALKAAGLVKPLEPEVTPKAIPEGVVRAMGSLACDMNDGKPDFIALRLECLKLAASPQVSELYGLTDLEQVADRFLHYVLNGLEKETGR